MTTYRSTATLAAFAGIALLSSACGTTIRTMSATAWVAPPGAPAAREASAAVMNPPAPPPGEPPHEGAPAPAPAPAPASAGGGLVSNYYVTYWEGSCKSLFGCGRGDSKVKRCKVNADNTVTCVDELNATKALTVP